MAELIKKYQNLWLNVFSVFGISLLQCILNQIAGLGRPLEIPQYGNMIMQM